MFPIRCFFQLFFCENGRLFCSSFRCVQSSQKPPLLYIFQNPQLNHGRRTKAENRIELYETADSLLQSVCWSSVSTIRAPRRRFRSRFPGKINWVCAAAQNLHSEWRPQVEDQSKSRGTDLAGFICSRAAVGRRRDACWFPLENGLSVHACLQSGKALL